MTAWMAAREGSIFDRMGRAKAKVFPLPVWLYNTLLKGINIKEERGKSACSMQSEPENRVGRAILCTLVGEGKPSSSHLSSSQRGISWWKRERKVSPTTSFFKGEEEEEEEGEEVFMGS